MDLLIDNSLRFTHLFTTNLLPISSKHLVEYSKTNYTDKKGDKAYLLPSAICSLSGVEVCHLPFKLPLKLPCFSVSPRTGKNID
jgi:hypothetical protein